MLNLKAAKELAARELDSQGSGAKIAAAPMPMSARQSSRYDVGDRVEYMSETYQQWMPGTVIRVREGGQTYDLDVKKGANVSKLRPLASGGLRSRSPAQPADCLSESIAGSVVPGSRPSSRPSSARGLREPPPRPAGVSASSAAAKDGPIKASTGSWRQVSRPPTGKEGLATLQAKQLQAELTHVTQAIQGQAADWAELSGQDMVSRAGAVTVRKMVETTKALLQGLEGALILRAGFIAGCFHMWRCETTLSRAGRLYQEEFERHHEEWTVHLEHTRASFEDQLRHHAEHEMGRKEIMKQHAALLIDKWAYGEKVAIRRESFRAWRSHAAKERKLKASASSIHVVVAQWAGGKVNGIARTALQSWHTLAVKERGVREKEDEQDKLKRQHQEQLEAMQAEHDKQLQAALQEIEARGHDNKRNIDVILAKWAAGSSKGLLTTSWKSWSEWARKQAESDRRCSSVESQVKKFLAGNERGSKISCFQHWKNEVLSAIEVRRQEAKEKEIENLNKMLFDQQEMNKFLENEKISAEEKRKREADAVIKMLLNKWEMGSNKGVLKTTFADWAKIAADEKKRARARQAVNDAVLRALEGDKKAAITISFRNWLSLTRSQRQERLMEENQAKQQEKFSKFMAQTQAEHDRALGELEDKSQSLATKAHQACQSMLSQWLGGEKKGLLKNTFGSWKEWLQTMAANEKRRNAVKSTIMRMAEGERRGTLHFAFMGWTRFHKEELEHAKLHAAQGAEIDQLRSKMDKMLAHAEARMTKYASLLAGKREPLLKGMSFSAWRTAAKGEVAEVESQREREVALQEMERQKQMLMLKHKETQARVLNAMGFKRSGLVLQETFQAWHYQMVKSLDDKAHKLNHNTAMLKYSEFIIKKMMMKDSKSMLVSCFTEWQRECRVMRHQAAHEDTHRSLQDVSNYAAQLERTVAELQEQIAVYDQQLDSVTETLQKELKTKEELATELRNAHAQMRKANFTPTTAATAGEGGDWSRRGDWSRTSSEKTIDQVVTPTPARQGKAAAAASQPPSLTVPALPGMPTMPTLPKGRSELLGKATSSASAGDATPEVSPRRVDWDAAVSRMNEDGYLGGRRPRRAVNKAPVDPDNLFNALDANHDGVISRSEWKSAVGSLPPREAIHRLS